MGGKCVTPIFFITGRKIVLIFFKKEIFFCYQPERNLHALQIKLSSTQIQSTVKTVGLNQSVWQPFNSDFFRILDLFEIFDIRLLDGGGNRDRLNL